MPSQPVLRVISGDAETLERLIDVDAASAARRDEEYYRNAGRMLESGLNGTTAYSQFLIKHGREPSPEEATALGRAMGRQIMASDGRRYPALTKEQRAAIRARRKEVEAHSDVWRQAHALARAIETLEQIGKERTPQEVVRHIEGLPREWLKIGERTENAVQWLRRFANEWQAAHAKGNSAKSSARNDRNH